MYFTITGRTHHTKNHTVAWVVTDEDNAFSNFINETIFDFADEMFGQDIADRIVNDLKKSCSFDEAFRLLHSWGYGIKYHASGENYER